MANGGLDKAALFSLDLHQNMSVRDMLRQIQGQTKDIVCLINDEYVRAFPKESPPSNLTYKSRDRDNDTYRFFDPENNVYVVFGKHNAVFLQRYAIPRVSNEVILVHENMRYKFTRCNLEVIAHTRRVS